MKLHHKAYYKNSTGKEIKEKKKTGGRNKTSTILDIIFMTNI